MLKEEAADRFKIEKQLERLMICMGNQMVTRELGNNFTRVLSKLK